VRRASGGRGDTRDYLEVYAVFHEVFGFLAAATQDVGVATFESDHPLLLLCPGDEGGRWCPTAGHSGCR